MNKFEYLEEIMRQLSLTRRDVLDYWGGYKDVDEQKCLFNKYELSEIRPGMFWFDDDTFSTIRLPDKKIKTIVELVKDNIIYGDMTVSEIFNIKAKMMFWDEIEEYISACQYLCNVNEKVVSYPVECLEEVLKTYDSVKRVLSESLGKKPRKKWQWSSSLSSLSCVWIVCFETGIRSTTWKNDVLEFRPVLSMKVI